MKKFSWVVLLTLLFITFGSSLLFVYATKDISGLLKKRIDSNYIQTSQLSQKFYSSNNYKLAWSNGGKPIAKSKELIKNLSAAYKHGLNPRDYHIDQLKLLVNKDEYSKKMLVELDVLLTDAYFKFSQHLLTGKVSQHNFYASHEKLDLVVRLKQALMTGRITDSLQELLPLQTVYHEMENALLWYQQIAQSGGWPKIELGPALKKGDWDKRVGQLRARLLVSGDLISKSCQVDDLFDASLEGALKYFQARHGLKADGILGTNTLTALNISVEQRIKQLIINMERLRWLPQNPGNRYLMVNIPDFKLSVIENEKKILTMKVIVGRTDRQTPVFSDKIQHLVINPYWKIPELIFKRDILPKIRNDIKYLSENNIKVFENWGWNAREIPARLINWQKVSPNNFKYKLRQEPGPDNALGRLKFIFPNQYNVYLHDTPHVELFEFPQRTFSSGCIRIEKPIELAEYLLDDTGKWNQTRIMEVVAEGKNKVVLLSKPIPVYLVYFTAWVELDGTIQFREDVYRRDEKLIRQIS